MPIPKNEEDMKGEGWLKELTLKVISVSGGAVKCQEWDFFASSFPCSIREGGNTGAKCGDMHTWLRSFNGKLFWCCYRHRIANGPISLETGRLAKEYPVSATEAVKICNDFGAEPPRELISLYMDEKASKAGVTRRPRPE